MHHLELSGERTLPLGFVPLLYSAGQMYIDRGEAALDPPSIVLTVCRNFAECSPPWQFRLTISG